MAKRKAVDVADVAEDQDEATELGGATPTNDAAETIGLRVPYVARVTLEGVAPILFHRYSCEAVEEKAAAPKNSKAKKVDDVESYVYRNDDGEICIPGKALAAACRAQGKSRQDPRSPRKSAHDLYKAIIIPLTELASVGTDRWDYLDQQRAVVQRNAVNRTRPAMKAGWRATFDLMVQAPEYLDPASLHDLLNDCGRFQGLGDFRPTYGRFRITAFGVVTDQQ